MVQLINKEASKFGLVINGVACIFTIPIELFTCESLIPLPKHIPKNRSVLHWYVGGKYVSYNQIKKAIKNGVT